MPESFELSAAKFVLGLLTAQDIEDLATSAMVQGHDGSALRLLAAGPIDSETDLNSSAKLMFKELETPLQDKEVSASLIATNYSLMICNGSVSPYEGAKYIWRYLTCVLQPNNHSLDASIYWADEYEEADDGERVKYCEQAICQSAQHYLDK